MTTPALNANQWATVVHALRVLHSPDLSQLADQIERQLADTANGDTQVVITSSAHDAIREAKLLIANARLWADNLTDFDWSAHGDDDALKEQEQRRELVREMERSWLTNFTHVVTMASGWDGPELRLWRDSEACVYWRHTKSSYEGGLIFHRDLRYSEPGAPLTVGTWSVHT